MKKTKDNKKSFSIDFSKMDAAIRTLLSSIIDMDGCKFKRQEYDDSKKKAMTSDKRLKKKINVDMIREILIRAKQTAKKNKNNK